MQKWECNLISFDYHNLILYEPTGMKTVPCGLLQEVVELLDQLGDQGWEVAGFTVDGNRFLWTIKRPKTK